MHTVHTHDFAILVKLWVVFCTMSCVFLAGDAHFTWTITIMSFFYIVVQCKWKDLLGFVLFYSLTSLLLILIRRYGFRMLIFSEFHVLVFWLMTSIFIVSWDLITSPPGSVSAFLSRIRAPAGVILGVLVIFRFFPTMKAEFRGLLESMHNRGLMSVRQILLHPVAIIEYILMPMLMRCLQMADQLSVSAISRGIEAPGVRSSYYATGMRLRDYACIATYIAFVSAFLIIGGFR